MDAPSASAARPGATSLGMHRIRPFPYPYKAMIAIESDIDRTSLARLRETHRFINTETETSMGPGVGLDFANSFWCYRRDCNPGTFGDRDEVGYWLGFERRARSSYADELIHYARQGRFGSLHSYGRFSEGFTRDHAARALDMLKNHDIRFSIWTNHGGYHAPNISTWLGPAPAMQGGRPLSRAYHADLLHGFGVRFFWSPHVRVGPGGVESPLVKTQLDDGRKVWAFGRSSVLQGGPEDIDWYMRKGLAVGRAKLPSAVAWQPYALDDMFSAARLDRIVELGRFSIFAQHLGNQFGAVAFDPEAVAALRRLRRYQDDGRILVAATERLLRFALARDHAVLSVQQTNGRVVVDIQAIDDPVSGRWTPTLNDLRGLAIELPDAGDADVVVAIKGKALDAADFMVHREAGGATAAVAWHDIDRTDHSAGFKSSGPRERYFRIYAGDKPENTARPWPPGEAETLLSAEAFQGLMRATDAQPPNIPLSADARVFALNEAGFAGALRATAFGQDAPAWFDALHDVGALLRPLGDARTALAFDDSKAILRWLEKSRAQYRPWVAVMSLPYRNASMASAFALIRGAIPEIASRMIHGVTVASLLARIAGDLAENRQDKAGPWLALLARDELRRLGPHGPKDGPCLPRDLAELERACLWADLGVYGAIADHPAAAPDPLGRRDAYLLAATPAPFLPRALATLVVREERYGGAAPTLRRQLDTLYEVFGADAALGAMTDDVQRALGPDSADLRRMASGDAPDLPSCFPQRPLSPEDRLLAMRAAALRGPEHASRWLDPIAQTADQAALLGWSYVAADKMEEAAGWFAAAIKDDPACQPAVVGTATVAAAGGGAAAIPTTLIETYLDAAERAATRAPASGSASGLAS